MDLKRNLTMCALCGALVVPPLHGHECKSACGDPNIARPPAIAPSHEHQHTGDYASPAPGDTAGAVTAVASAESRDAAGNLPWRLPLVTTSPRLLAYYVLFSSDEITSGC